MSATPAASGGPWPCCSSAPIPPGLGFTFPIGVLVGVLIGLGRLSADSEIVALHASGISLRRLLLPIGVVALVATGGTLLTTFWLSPLALRTVARLEQQLLSSQAPFAVQPRVFDERFPKFILYVQDVAAAATSTGGREYFWHPRRAQLQVLLHSPGTIPSSLP